MPDSLISQLVNNAWDEINQAVSVGLAFGNQKTLSDVITVLTKQLATMTWEPRVYEQAGAGRRCVRQSATAAAFDYRYRFPLSYDTLRSPDTDSIKDWAASVRGFELQHVLDRLAAAAQRHDFTPGNLHTATVGGWGQLRCLTFTPVPGAIPVPDDLAPMGWDGPVKIDLASPRAPIQALLFRVGSGPYVQRQADLTLGWIPRTDDGADLVLAEQLQLVSATRETITGIHMVRR
jgi:hypothetical protein